MKLVREHYRLVLTLLLVGLAQVTLAWRLQVGGVIPDLWLLGVAVAALRLGPAGGAGVGFGLGLFVGLAEPVHLAVMPACGLVVGALVGMPHRITAEENWFVQALVGFVATFLFYILHYLFVPSLGFRTHLAFGLQAGLYSALLAPAFFHVFNLLRGPQRQLTLF